MPNKIIISPGQGLLLLIRKYKEDKDKVLQLKKLYLCGSTNDTEKDKLNSLLKDPLLNEYEISISKKIINNDSSRRYFETHLAYETVKQNLKQVEKNDLDKYKDNLKKQIPIKVLEKYNHVLNGDYKETDDNFLKEYTDYIKKIKSKKIFSILPKEDRDKLLLLIQGSFLGVINAQINELPLNIYGTGIYAPRNKGKRVVKEQKSTRNKNLGLMKGHMPISIEDIASSHETFTYLKSSDQATYYENAQWVKQNFSMLTHPYSNSISGTMLCQLRSHAKIMNDGDTGFKSSDKLGRYAQLLSSAILYNCGGHTLYEFLAPFELSAVKDEFKSIEGLDQINLENLFLNNNENAFEKALNNAIEYNQSTLLRVKLTIEIKSSTNILAKAQRIKTICKKYRKELLEDIGDHIKSYDSVLYKSIFKGDLDPTEKLKILNSGYVINNPGTLSYHESTQLKKLQENNNIFRLSIAKFSAISQMIEPLECKLSKLSAGSITEFEKRFNENRKILCMRRDSTLTRMLKFIGNVCSFGLFSKKLFEVKGRNIANKLKSEIDIKNPSKGPRIS